MRTHKWRPLIISQLPGIVTLLFAMVCALPVSAQFLCFRREPGHTFESTTGEPFEYDGAYGSFSHQILYVTSDVHGQPDTASGLLVIPDTPLVSSMPAVIYQHGTTDGPDDVPSRLHAGSDESLAYGAMGYVAIAADYLGLGENAGFHPYLHAASEASAAVDMLFAATEWIENATGEAWLGNLFVSGYPQGGHAAAALQQDLERNWGLIYPLTASTLMSGPYSLSGVMYDRIISDQIYYSPAYIPYVVIAYQEVYGNLYTDLNDIFKPAYVPAIESFRNHQSTTTALNTTLLFQLLQSGTVQPKKIILDSVLQDIINNPNNPLRVDLRDNDLYDWTPQAPTRLYYCTLDEQVPYQNALVADSVMHQNGAPDLVAMDLGALGHGPCATPAITQSIQFFDSFLLPSSVHTETAPDEIILSENNPVSGMMHINPDLAQGISEMQLINMEGRLVLERKQIAPQISVQGIPPGIYLLCARYDNQPVHQKIVIQ